MKGFVLKRGTKSLGRTRAARDDVGGRNDVRILVVSHLSRECTVCSFGTQRPRSDARWESGFADGRPCEVSRATGCLREAGRRIFPSFASETLAECGRRPRSVSISDRPLQ